MADADNAYGVGDKQLEKIGAGEGNRTLVSGLGSPHSTIELMLGNA